MLYVVILASLILRTSSPSSRSVPPFSPCPSTTFVQTYVLPLSPAAKSATLAGVFELFIYLFLAGQKRRDRCVRLGVLTCYRVHDLR